MRRLLNHTHVSQKKKTKKKKRRKKKKRKKLDPENAERVPNKQQFQKPRHEKEALPSGAPHAGGASSVSLQSRCDSPQAASFLGASAGQWNHGTGRPKSRFVFPWVSPHVLWRRGNGEESLESRTDLCHGESRYGGRFCHPNSGLSFCQSHLTCVYPHGF